MDVKLLKVLENCGCLELYKHFQGITLRELRDLPGKLLKKKLTDLLSSATISSSLISQLAGQIVDVDESDDDDINSENIKNEPKLEVEDTSGIVVEDVRVVEPASGTTRTDSTEVEDDNEPIIVDEVFAVSFVECVEKEIPELTIEDVEIDPPISQDSDSELTDDEAVDPFNENAFGSKKNPTAGPSRTQDLRVKDPKKGIFFAPTPEIIKKISNLNRCYIFFSGVDMYDATAETPLKKSGNKRRKMDSTTNSTKCVKMNSATTPLYSKPSWNSLYEACGVGRIHVLDCMQWKWNSLDDESPNNLFRLLYHHCSNLEELNFYSNCVVASTHSKPLDLPNLKTLTICQDSPEDERGKMVFPEVFNFGIQIKDIIVATNGALEKIEFYFQHELSVHEFLKVLINLDLRGLKSLSFFNNVYKGKVVSLVDIELEMVSKLNCLNLEYLELDFCFWENSKDAFESILRRFTKLRKLVVSGCFTTMRKKEPKIILKFPRMKHLEELDLGRSDITATADSFENIHARPRKRKKRNLFRVEPSEDTANPSSSKENENEEEGPEDQGEYFSVTVNLPNLPKLKELQLGRLYEFEELHFRRMPNLIAFRVSSPWHLSFKFPTQASRHKEYPLIKELQLPDGLLDDEFVRKVMPIFPNVEKCYIILPTVKVLRAFAFIMKNTDRLKFLEVAIQFDFLSLLAASFLEKPSSLIPSTCEENNIFVLKSYKFWEEYAKFHNIEVPVYQEEAAEILEDHQKYAGLCALNDKFQNDKDFFIRHLPRTLRLPCGELHWDDAKCKYSNTLIGFKKFPYTKEAWFAGPKGIFPCKETFNLNAVPHRVLSYKRDLPLVGLDSYTQPIFNKKENRQKEYT